MSKICKIIIYDEVRCKFENLLEYDQTALYKKFSIYVDGYRFMPKFKLRLWDGKKHFFNEDGMTFVKLLPEIIEYLCSRNYEFEFVDNRDGYNRAVKLVTEDIFSHCIGYGGKPLMMRPYQVEAVNKLLENESGILIAGTGAGKTLMTAGLARALNDAGMRVIILVPSTDLVNQTYELFDMAKIDVGKFTGSEKNNTCSTTIATWQTVQNCPEMLEDYQSIVWDEAHGIRGNVAQKLLSEYAKHIVYRFGVTGTLPKSKEQEMSIFSVMGRVVHTITSKWLIDNGYLAKVQIQPMNITVDIDRDDLESYKDEKEYLIKNEPRRKKIRDQIIAASEKYGNTLILVNSISFGKKLQKMTPGSIFLAGESPSDLRKEHYDMFEENDGLIVIASIGIASTGISINRIFCLMFIDAGKSFITAIQGVGRGLRLGRDKTEVMVVDMFSSLKTASKHFKERVKWYSEVEYPVLKLIHY